MLSNNPVINYRSAVINMERSDPLPNAPSVLRNVVAIALGEPQQITTPFEDATVGVTSANTSAGVGDPVQLRWANGAADAPASYAINTEPYPTPDFTITETIDGDDLVIQLEYNGVADFLYGDLEIALGTDTVHVPFNFREDNAIPNTHVDLTYADKTALDNLNNVGLLANGEYDELKTMHTFVLLSIVTSWQELEQALRAVNDAPDMYSAVIMTPTVSQMWYANRINCNIPMMLSDIGENFWDVAQMAGVGVMACEAGDGALCKAVTYMCQDNASGLPQFTNRITDTAIRGITSNSEKARHREAGVSFWMVTRQKAWPMRLTVGGAQLFVRMYQLVIDEAIKNAAASIISEGHSILGLLDGRLQVSIISVTSRFSAVLDDSPTVLVPSPTQITTNDRLTGDLRGVTVRYSVFGEAVELFINVEEDV